MPRYDSMVMPKKDAPVEVVYQGVGGVVERIGSELEAALDGMAPRCEICGASFAADQKIIINGSAKKHVDCFRAGKPMHAREMAPLQAARHLPSLLTIRVFVNSKWFTFFLVRKPSSDDQETQEYVSLEYVPDDSAHSPPVRQCPEPLLGLETVIDCEGVGDCSDYVLRGQLEFEGDDEVLTAHISHAKYSLAHDLAVRLFHLLIIAAWC